MNSPEYRRLLDEDRALSHWVLLVFRSRRRPGINRSEPYEAAMLLNHLQERSKLPLLIAADFESGLSSRLNETIAVSASHGFWRSRKN